MCCRPVCSGRKSHLSVYHIICGRNNRGWFKSHRSKVKTRGIFCSSLCSPPFFCGACRGLDRLREGFKVWSSPRVTNPGWCAQPTGNTEGCKLVSRTIGMASHTRRTHRLRMVVHHTQTVRRVGPHGFLHDMLLLLLLLRFLRACRACKIHRASHFHFLELGDPYTSGCMVHYATPRNKPCISTTSALPTHPDTVLFCLGFSHGLVSQCLLVLFLVALLHPGGLVVPSFIY